MDFDELWNRFVRKTMPMKGNDLLKPFVMPVNFLGSIEQHKKMFMEAVKEMQNLSSISETANI